RERSSQRGNGVHNEGTRATMANEGNALRLSSLTSFLRCELRFLPSLRTVRSLLLTDGRRSTVPLPDHMNAVWREMIEPFDSAVGPAHLHRRNGRSFAEPKMYAHVVMRQVTAAASDLAHLGRAFLFERHARTARIAVTGF